MRPTRTNVAQALAVILPLAVAGCAGSSESSPTISEAAASEGAFATCGTASITVDQRDHFQASIAGFLEGARTSGCSYDGLQIADSPRGNEEGYEGALAVANDFVDAFNLSWTVEPEVSDASLSVHDVRVTLFASDRQVAETS